MINVGYFGLKGYPHDDTQAFLAARSAALMLGIRRAYVPAAPGAAYNPDEPDPLLRVPHYLSDRLPLDGEFEWYGDGKFATYIKIVKKDMRALFYADSGSANARLPGIRVRDMTLIGRSNEYSAPHVRGDGTEHYHLIAAHGVEGAEFDVGILYPRGDGILLGGGDSTEDERHNRNVHIINPFMRGNDLGRNGIAIIDGDGVYIDDPDIRNISDPAMPGSIDVEPNYTHEIVRNIHVRGGTLQTRGGAPFNFQLSHATDEYLVRPENITVDSNLIQQNPDKDGLMVFAYGAAPTYDMNLRFNVRISGTMKRPLVVYGVSDAEFRGSAEGFSDAGYFGDFTQTKARSARKITVDLNVLSGGDRPYILGQVQDLVLRGDYASIPGIYYVLDGAQINGFRFAPRRIAPNVPSIGSLAANYTNDRDKNIFVAPDDLPRPLWQAQQLPFGSGYWPTARSTDTPASAKPNTWPLGESRTTINGGVGWPTGAGVVETVISPVYGRGGLGFSFQRFTGRQGALSGIWIRTAADPDNPDSDWGPFRRIPVAVPTHPALADLPLTATPEQIVNTLNTLLAMQREIGAIPS